MIWQLMKRDPAWRLTAYMTLAFSAVCAFWQLFMPAFMPDGSFVSQSPVFLLFGFATGSLLYAALYAAAEQQDETGLQSILPVTVRQIFLARTVSTVVLLWLPVLAGLAVMTARHDPGIAALPLRLFSIAMFGVLGVQCAVIRGRTLSRRLVAVLPMLWMFLSDALRGFSGSAGWPFEDGSLTGGLVLGACWLIGAGVVWRTWRTIPESFQDAASKISQEATPAPSRIPGRHRYPWLPVWRTLFLWGGLWLLLMFNPMLIESSGWAVEMMFVGAAWQQARRRFGWLTALPVSGRALLAGILLPPILAVMAGYLVSVHLPVFPQPHQRGISVRAMQELPEWLHGEETPGCKTLNVLPSLEFWVPVKAGQAPLLRSPWGETFQPSAFYISGYDIYNPYAVGCGNSRRFLEWQFNRATIAVYGRPLVLDTSDGWHNVEMRKPVAGIRTQLVSLSVIAALSMLLVLISMVFEWYRFRRLARAVRIAVMSVAGILGAGFLMLTAFGYLNIAQWVSWTVPASAPGAFAVIVSLLAMLFFAIDRLSTQLEFVDKPATRPV